MSSRAAKVGDLGDLDEFDKATDFSNAPISIEEAASMYRTRVRANDPPYTTAVIKLNNKLVDEWKSSVLSKYADSKGNIKCVIVEPSWDRFYEGKQVIKYMELLNSGVIPVPTEEQLQFWINLFENSTVEELHPYGSGTLNRGWALIENYLRMWSAKEKYERIYSQTDDPYEWNGLAHKNRALVSGNEYPFWGLDKIKEIREKLYTVLAVQPKIK